MEDKRTWAMEQLCRKAQELGHRPRKEDFDVGTTARIKSILGPWPRALEAAGLKEPKKGRKEL